MKKIVLLAFVLVLFSTAVIVGLVRPVEAHGTIYISADGSVVGTDKIQRDGNVYTFTGNINDSIVVERDDIVIDGAGYTMQGIGSENGVDLTQRSNVTVENTTITGFGFGISVFNSSNIVFSGNNITNNVYGVHLYSFSANNTISGNNIKNNGFVGVYLRDSSDNTVSGNNITNDEYGIRVVKSSSNTISGNNIIENYEYGIYLYDSSNNTISGNNIKNNAEGVSLQSSCNNNTVSGNNITSNKEGVYIVWSSNNRIYHNKFINNTQQVHFYEYGYANVWDDGYPSGGNCWSDYEERYPNATEIDGSGIWDTPYVIDENNQDNYPIVPEFPAWISMLLLFVVLTVTIAICKRRLLKAPIH